MESKGEGFGPLKQTALNWTQLNNLFIAMGTYAQNFLPAEHR